ncbi:unnamed protein product [Clavelina lepadiformis]|uniref:Uncharacterized protein n=1 Tax=Clavelina lepadiformis TaxID=159417 RepID=A0ABP0G685_CLALP
MALARMKCRRHNVHVLQNAPKDKLLVFNVKEGWEPHCTFLGVEVLSKPFPSRNVKGETAKDFMDKDPTLQLVKRELAVVFLFLLLLCGVSFNFARESSFSSWYQTLVSLPLRLWK